MAEPLPYRPNVCMLVYNARRALLLGRHMGGDTWQFPQGGAKSELSLEENVYKELSEELGLARQALGQLTRLNATHRYEFNTVPLRWKKRWRGQEQTFWAVELCAPDSAIRLDTHDPAEFSQWRWCSTSDLLAQADPVRRDGYLEPLREFIGRIGPTTLTPPAAPLEGGPS